MYWSQGRREEWACGEGCPGFLIASPPQVMKTLEQSVMEVEEEHELSAMTSFKGAWYERLDAAELLSEQELRWRLGGRQKSMMAAWQEQVEEDPTAWKGEGTFWHRHLLSPAGVGSMASEGGCDGSPARAEGARSSRAAEEPRAEKSF